METYKILNRAVSGKQGKGQDAVYGSYQRGIHAIALADGITSAQLSKHGAMAAVQAVVSFLIKCFDDIMKEEEGKLRVLLYEFFRRYYLPELSRIGQTVPAIREAPVLIQDDQGRSRMIPQNLGLYSTTILAAALRDEDLILLKIGNGVIAACTDEGWGVVEHSLLTARSATPAIEQIIDHSFRDYDIHRYSVPCLRSLVLMSDGVESLWDQNGYYSLYDSIHHNLSDAFPKWFHSASQSQETFQSAVEFLGTQAEDDVSAAALVRIGDEGNEIRIIKNNPLELYAVPYRISRAVQQASAARLSPTAVDVAPDIPAHPPKKARQEEGFAGDEFCAF